MNSDIFIIARMGSSRLPAKHLKIILNKPIILHLIERLRLAKKVRKIVVCTTRKKEDDILVELLKKENIEYFRGSEKDILDRFYQAAKFFQTDIIVDVEGDKIYTDPTYVDKVVEEMEQFNIDYVEGELSDKDLSQIHGIHGFIPAGINVNSLQKIILLKKTENTETGYKEFFTKSKNMKLKYIELDSELKIPEHTRLTLDYQEDFELAIKIFDKLGNFFNAKDVIKLLTNETKLLSITEPLIKKWDKYYKQNLTDNSLNSNEK
jgi:spore coat polysaccharide biosynthesis protein SpsF